MAQNKSVTKVTIILDALIKANYAVGLSHAEIIKLTSLTPSDVTRYVSDLESTGYVEIIAETSRIRIGLKLAQAAAQIQRSLDAAMRQHQASFIKIFGENV